MTTPVFSASTSVKDENNADGIGNVVGFDIQDDTLMMIKDNLPQLLTNIENGMKAWDKEHGSCEYKAYELVKKSLGNNPNTGLLLFATFI